jgi:hypothetical protein
MRRVTISFRDHEIDLVISRIPDRASLLAQIEFPQGTRFGAGRGG